MNPIISTPPTWTGTENLETNLPSLSNSQPGIFLIEGTRTIQGNGRAITRNCYFVAIGTTDSKGKFQLTFSEPYSRMKGFELTANPWEFRCVEFISDDTQRKGSDGHERTATERITEHLSKEVNQTGSSFHVAREQQARFLSENSKSLPKRLAEAVASITTKSY